MQNMQEIKITSFNVNGVHNPIKRSKILSKLKKGKTHIAFLQETHLNEIEHRKLGRLGYKHVYSSSHKVSSKRGVAILINNILTYEHILEKKDSEGRYILIKGRLEGAMITLLNVYAPPNSEWDFYRQIFDIMASEGEGTLICGGDFNIKLNDKLDSSRPTLRQSKTIKKIKTTMQEMGIVDVWSFIQQTVTIPTSLIPTLCTHGLTIS